MTRTLRVWIKEGRCRKIGTWSAPWGHGDVWAGDVFGYRIGFETQGRDLVPGSFSYRV